MYFREFCYLISSCIRKSITLMFISALWNKFTLCTKTWYVGGHPCGHQHGVSIQISINLDKTFLSLSHIQNILLAWILVRVFLYLTPFISQIPDFIYWTVLTFILIYFEWRDSENQQYYWYIPFFFYQPLLPKDAGFWKGGGVRFVAFKHFFFSKKPKKMKSTPSDFIFQRTPTKKLVNCYSSHLWGWGRGAWIKNWKILIIEDTDTCIIEPHFKDNPLLQTVFFVPGESPYIFSKFNLLNTHTRWIVDNGHFFLAQ